MQMDGWRQNEIVDNITLEHLISDKSYLKLKKKFNEKVDVLRIIISLLNKILNIKIKGETK